MRDTLFVHWMVSVAVLCCACCCFLSSFIWHSDLFRRFCDSVLLTFSHHFFCCSVLLISSHHLLCVTEWPQRLQVSETTLTCLAWWQNWERFTQWKLTLGASRMLEDICHFDLCISLLIYCTSILSIGFHIIPNTQCSGILILRITLLGKFEKFEKFQNIVKKNHIIIVTCFDRLQVIHILK